MYSWFLAIALAVTISWLVSIVLRGSKDECHDPTSKEQVNVLNDQHPDPRAWLRGSAFGDDNRSEYEAIRRFNAHVYRGLDLDPASSDIRVVVQKGFERDLVTVPLKSNYIALSYAWGDECDVCEITVNRQTFKVTRNLFEALVFLHAAEIDYPIWIDALCINQDDAAEKSVQVRRIKDVYAGAGRTIVWLGPGTEGTNRFIDYVNKFALDHYDIDPQENLKLLVHGVRTNLAVLKGFGELIVLPYFRRLWIVQELMVSQGPEIMCGTRMMPFFAIPILMRVAINFSINISQCQTTMGVSPYQKNLALLYDFRDEMDRSGGAMDLSVWIGLVGVKHQCRDPRDKIFGLLGLSLDRCSEELAKLNYTMSPNEIYTETTKYILRKHNDLDFICIGRGPDRNQELSSWVPDFRLNPSRSFPSCTKDPLIKTHAFAAGGPEHSASHPAINARAKYDEAVKSSPDYLRFMSDVFNKSILVTQGIVVDTVYDMGELYDIDWLEEPKHADSILSTTQLAHHQKILHETEQIAHKRGRYNKWIYSDSPASYQHALSRTLVCGRDADGEPCKPGGGFYAFKDPKIPTSNSQLRLQGPDVTMDDLKVHLPRLRRHFMVSSAGYIGLVPPGTRKHALICVLFNCSVPVILHALWPNRPAGSRKFVFVGEW
ncbi:uncharacterized protein KY384_005775 [Bacidia gigantensis]|uniref:uncharacterized protein n=1 Tax=Bacidia gigantensis TaxID=2732470 RepID=UPI001D039B96|nr:uncharacterized protein KY384_005775 [Bacidia gigantensis]KAG8529140.1 hypothetical protein KY384_005775 [Bacidia gigantensis]